MTNCGDGLRFDTIFGVLHMGRAKIFKFFGELVYGGGCPSKPEASSTFSIALCNTFYLDGSFQMDDLYRGKKFKN